jgi:hypothetical protein
MSAHTIIGLFKANDYKSRMLLRDLGREFDNPLFVILWHRWNKDPPKSDDPLYKKTVGLWPEKVWAWLEREIGLPAAEMATLVDAYPVLDELTLLLYCRRVLGIEYAVYTDNDIFLFEPIPEIVALSAEHRQFLIPECGNTDKTLEVMEWLGRQKIYVNYLPALKGLGYNIGFYGADLRVFDHLDAGELAYLFRNLGSWGWPAIQTLIVRMMFTKPMHTLEQEKYLFLPHDHPDYRKHSKIFHAIFTRDKSCVDRLYRNRSAANALDPAPSGA